MRPAPSPRRAGEPARRSETPGGAEAGPAITSPGAGRGVAVRLRRAGRRATSVRVRVGEPEERRRSAGRTGDARAGSGGRAGAVRSGCGGRRPGPSHLGVSGATSFPGRRMVGGRSLVRHTARATAAPARCRCAGTRRVGTTGDRPPASVGKAPRSGGAPIRRCRRSRCFRSRRLRHGDLPGRCRPVRLRLPRKGVPSTVRGAPALFARRVRVASSLEADTLARPFTGRIAGGRAAVWT